MQYGIDCAFSRSLSNPIDAEAAQWIYRRAERFNPRSGSANAWIPEGLPLDLIDDNSQLARLGIIDPVNDQVQSFTNQQIFDAITNGTPETMSSFIVNIKSYNNSIWIDTLITDYNY